MAESESKSKSDKIGRLNEEIEAMKNELVERKEAFRKKNIENDFKIKYELSLRPL